MPSQADHTPRTEDDLSDGPAETGFRGSDDPLTRLGLYSYLTARERRGYIAIMRLFTSTLLADLGAGEVAAALAEAERRGEVEPGESRLETVVDRLEQLAKWGNLVPGRREPVATIAEFTQSRMRYQVSKLATRVQREVDGVLAVAEGAREVSRELLPAIEQGLAAIQHTVGEIRTVERSGADGTARRLREDLARHVTTLFLQHDEFAAAVRDFYAYLGSVIARYDLAPAEMSGFKHMLLEYVELIAKDVLRHSEPIVDRLGALERCRTDLLDLLGARGDDLSSSSALPRFATRPGPAVQPELMERAPGRRASDWDGLADWFVGRPGRPSEVSALRDATSRAITALLTNVKRVSGVGGVDPGRRRDLLTLASWFDEASPEAAHDLYTSAFGLFSARHLALCNEDDAAAPDRSWAEGARVRVDVNVGNRGERAATGRIHPVTEDPLGRAALLQEQEQRRRRRDTAVGELAASAQDLASARLSGDALEIFCELLALAGASRDTPAEGGIAADPISGLTLSVEQRRGHSARVGSVLGTLELRDTEVRLELTEPMR
ncbi:DUF2397 domain-containing protein [Nocardiopsis ansamitocini]|nr:DUF2397 domain-containing protein [Nocardiopsis ansamitocini]